MGVIVALLALGLFLFFWLWILAQPDVASVVARDDARRMHDRRKR
jgi:hypothetical protein